MLSEGGIRHFVCVASEYGNDVMSTNPCAVVRVGKMNENEMADYLKCQNPEKVKKVFIVHGETKVQEKYAKYLKKNNGFKDIVIPEPGETFKV